MKLRWILVLLLTSVAFGQSHRISEVLISGGQPFPTIRVCTEPASGTPCSPLATIYSDPGLTIPLANPFVGDAGGNYAYYSVAGNYHEQISGNNFATYDVAYVPMWPTTGLLNLSVQTDGTPNTSQAILNFVDANGCTWTNPSAGNEEVSCSGGGVTGSGTTGTLPVWTGSTSLGNSFVKDTTGSILGGNAIAVAGTEIDMTGGAGAANDIACTVCSKIILNGPTVGGHTGSAVIVIAGNGSTNAAEMEGNGDNGNGNPHNFRVVTAGSVLGGGTVNWVQLPTIIFASLPSTSVALVGSVMYCSDCTVGSSPCTGSGTGTFAFLMNTGTPAWKCPF